MTALAERHHLQRTIDGLRQHVLSVVGALEEEQRRTSTLPSGWTPIGLVRHLTHSDERYWFHAVVAGRPLDGFPTEPNGDWLVPNDLATGTVLEEYRDAIATSNEIIGKTALDDPPRFKDPQWAEWGIDFPDLRTIMHHMIVETATHAGHLDAAVELIDGRQWIVLD